MAIIHLGIPSLDAQAAYPDTSAALASSVPIFGLAPDGVYLATPITCGTGGLLHHPFTLTPQGGFFSVALSRTLPWVDVIYHPVLWSPDFPRKTARLPGCPVRGLTLHHLAL